jgi:hypothetical protein
VNVGDVNVVVIDDLYGDKTHYVLGFPRLVEAQKSAA